MSKILVREDEKRVADLVKIGLDENADEVVVGHDVEVG